jgi:hypothetical protein
MKVMVEVQLNISKLIISKLSYNQIFVFNFLIFKMLFVIYTTKSGNYLKWFYQIR